MKDLDQDLNDAGDFIKGVILGWGPIILILVLIGLAVKYGEPERYDPENGSGYIGCTTPADCY